MMLYHGSYLEIADPDLNHSRPNVDFRRGFYVTSLYEQAAKWCGKFKHRGKDGIISRYKFDGLIDKSEAINRLHYEKPNLQICFRTEKALGLLRFEGSELV